MKAILLSFSFIYLLLLTANSRTGLIRSPETPRRLALLHRLDGRLGDGARAVLVRLDALRLQPPAAPPR